MGSAFKSSTSLNKSKGLDFEDEVSIDEEEVGRQDHRRDLSADWLGVRAWLLAQGVVQDGGAGSGTWDSLHCGTCTFNTVRGTRDSGHLGRAQL